MYSQIQSLGLDFLATFLLRAQSHLADMSEVRHTSALIHNQLRTDRHPPVI